jgi:hypothetical protein
MPRRLPNDQALARRACPRGREGLTAWKQVKTAISGASKLNAALKTALFAHQARYAGTVRGNRFPPPVAWCASPALPQLVFHLERVREGVRTYSVG